MDPFVVTLESIRQTDAAQVGDKATALGTLLAAGFPVLDGLCITVAAFHLALAAYQAEIDTILRQAHLSHPASAQSAADTIARLLADLTVPLPVASALQSHLCRSIAHSTIVAVRSSALGEDGAQTSFAGQYTSVLGVQGQAEIESALVTCWHSFFHSNALAARAQRGVQGETEGMAVLIQPLLEAECAGVCFSVDPVQHRRTRAVVSAAWGLGAGVVDGSVACDTIWVQRDYFSVEQSQIVEKPEQIMLVQGSGLQHTTVPASHRRAACLPAAWLERIVQFSVAAETLFGRPQELEWAIAGDQVWLLQSRPITGLPPELAHTPPFPVVWKSDQESRFFWQREGADYTPEVLLPLEQDHWVHLESCWEEACRLVGVEFDRRFKFCNGRAYFRHTPIQWTEAERRIRRNAMEDLQARLQQEDRTTWDHWGPEIVKATERLRAFEVATAGGAELANHLEEALAVRRRHYVLHPLCSFEPQPAYFAAFSALTGLSEIAARETAYRLLDGGETPLSHLIDGIYTLACAAKQYSSVAALIANPPPDVLVRLRAHSQAGDFLDQLDAFLQEYGTRTGDGYGSEASLRTPTWQEQPEMVLALIALYLNPEVETPAAARARAQESFNTQVEALCAASVDPGAIAEFRRQLAYARKTFAVLEVHNHYIDQMSLGQLRQAVKAAADWLVRQGALSAPDDVLWLCFGEILNALRSVQPVSFLGAIAARQADYAAWSELEAPPLLGVPDARLPERPPLGDDVTGDDVTGDDVTGPTWLTGQGASAGQRRGPARIVRDPVALPALAPGDILVARNIGPLWTPLFPILGGLILAGGSLGQHAAATAREYGIPAVVEVRHALQHISDGDWVTVDGTAGTVELG